MKQAKRITYTGPDYANMPAAARATMQADLERHYFTPRYQCSPFDPAGLVALALEQLPDRPEFAEALGRCTQQWPESEFYTHLRDPAERGTPVAYAGGFRLLCPKLGELVIDMLADGSVDGIEYLDLVMSQYDDEHEALGVSKAPPVLRIVHWKDQSGGFEPGGWESGVGSLES